MICLLPVEMAVLAGARELQGKRNVARAPLRNMLVAKISVSQTKERGDNLDQAVLWLVEVLVDGMNTRRMSTGHSYDRDVFRMECSCKIIE